MMLKRLLMIAVLLSGMALGQGYSPVPVPRMQFFTDTGAVANGYKVCSYLAGTVTPQNTYTDYSGGTPNTNPVILDSTGRANIWLGNTSYKLVLRTPGTDSTCATGTAVWTVDNIGGYCTLSGCTMSGPLTVTTATGNATLIVSSTGNPGIGLSSSGSGSTGASIGSSGTGATIGAIISTSNGNASSVGLVAKNSNNSADIFQAQIANGSAQVRINSTGIILNSGTLTLGGAGGLNINGGTALTTSNQTGTGNLVMAATPTITSATLTTPTASSPTLTGTTMVNVVSLQRTDASLANGANNNVAMTGFSSLRITGPTGAFSISGFAAGVNGQVLHVFNSVAFAMTLTNEGAASTAANRITTLTGADVVLRAGTSFASFIYDGATSRWILMSSN